MYAMRIILSNIIHSVSGRTIMYDKWEVNNEGAREVHNWELKRKYVGGYYGGIVGFFMFIFIFFIIYFNVMDMPSEPRFTAMLFVLFLMMPMTIINALWNKHMMNKFLRIRKGLNEKYSPAELEEINKLAK